MNLIEVNTMIIQNLKTQYPNNFQNIEIKDNLLTLNNETTPIDKYNLYNLLSEQPIFTNNLSNLNNTSIFEIIKLHTEKLSDKDYNKFYNLLSSTTINEKEQKFMQKCYTKLTSYMRYNDFLTLDLTTKLQTFVNYILLLELNDKEKTTIEQNAIEKYREMISSTSNNSDQKENEEEYKLELKKNGFISNIEIIAITLGFLTFFICSILCLLHH